MQSLTMDAISRALNITPRDVRCLRRHTADIDTDMRQLRTPSGDDTRLRYDLESTVSWLRRVLQPRLDPAKETLLRRAAVEVIQ